MKVEEQNKILLENRRFREALEFIAKWELPLVDDGEGGKASYEFMMGSNGVKAYIREIAKNALQ